MIRRHITIPQGAHQVEEVVVIQGDDAPGEGVVGFMALVTLMRQVLVDQPSMLRHANDCPGTVSISHNGAAWTIEARTLTTVNDADSSSGPSSRG